MKRSEINRYIAEADAFCAANQFLLPPFAHWTPEDWRHRGSEANDLRAARLGWDVTDFCSGHFDSFGLTLFTMRNGTLPGNKVYAEKMMFVRLNQHNPLHYHISKTEDIINRGLGTGRLAVELYNSTPAEPGSNGGLAQTPVTVVCDGVVRQVEAGGTVVLGPGESVTLTPYLYHRFYAIGGHGLIGEVSSVNDDATDNYFYEALPRFPEIEEDEPPLRLLCNEYQPA
jgi:D-lyxose ketol-isomerase